MRRTALITLALTALALVLESLVFHVLRARLFAELEAGAAQAMAILESLERLSRLQTWIDRGLYCLFGGALGAASVRARGIARGLAVAGLGLLVVALAASFFEPRIEGALTTAHKATFYAIALLTPAGVTLGTAGLALEARRRAYAACSGALWVAFAIVAAIGQFRDWRTPAPLLRWVWIASHVALLLGAALVAALLARAPAAGASEPAGDPSPAALRVSGAPFRVLGGALVARLALALGTQGLLVSALMDKDFAAAQGWVTLGAFGTVLVGLVTASGLVMEHRGAVSISKAVK